MKVECTVCCEDVSSNQVSQCVYCEYKCCKTCLKRYISETSEDANCMNCKNVFSLEHIETMLSKTWIQKDYKKIREDILMDREKSMLPDSQVAVRQEITKRENIKFREELTKERQEILRQLRALDTNITNVSNAINGNVAAVQNAERPVFNYKCGSEDCRGFLDSRHKCGVCEKIFCKECNEEMHEGHECDQANVETVRMLRKDTKPCPGCGTMIFKISGCNQMWCTSCKTAFDWRTGRIEIRNIHNPHYYEFMRSGNVAMRQPGDMVCGGIPPVVTIRTKFMSAYNINDTRYRSGNLYRDVPRMHSEDEILYNKILDSHRIINHINRVELRNYRTDQNENNLDLRVKFLMKEIEENDWKRELQKREKARVKKVAIYQVLSMVDEVGTHMFLRELETKESFQIVSAEFETLRVYANNEFLKIGKRFNCRTPTIVLVGEGRYDIR